MNPADVPTLSDAEARRQVRLPDGRTARLVGIPGNRSKGAKARVRLPSGAHLSFPLTDLTLIPEDRC